MIERLIENRGAITAVLADRTLITPLQVKNLFYWIREMIELETKSFTPDSESRAQTLSNIALDFLFKKPVNTYLTSAAQQIHLYL